MVRLFGSAALVVLIASTALFANILTPGHGSTEELFSAGGTQVTCACPCTSFTTGDGSENTPGTLTEEAALDSTTNKTIFPDFFTNDNPLLLTSCFAILSNQVLPLNFTVPGTRTLPPPRGSSIYSTRENFAIPQSASLLTVNVTQRGTVPMAFSPTKIEAGNGDTVLMGATWLASWPLAEPDQLALFGMGLVSAAVLLRRKLTS